jgi:hypothetical protein
MADDYKIAHQARKVTAHGYTAPEAFTKTSAANKSTALPPSKGESVKPDFLLHHENHFDRNTVKDQDVIKQNTDEADPEKQT